MAPFPDSRLCCTKQFHTLSTWQLRHRLSVISFYPQPFSGLVGVEYNVQVHKNTLVHERFQLHPCQVGPELWLDTTETVPDFFSSFLISF